MIKYYYSLLLSMTLIDYCLLIRSTLLKNLLVDENSEGKFTDLKNILKTFDVCILHMLLFKLKLLFISSHTHIYIHI